MNLFESAEDYLERILMLTEKNGSVRSIDIANDMKFSKASVSIAMKKLREKGYIEVNESSGFIILTPSGMKIAQNIYNRHKVISRFFILIGVNEETALEDACKIEHDLSDETFEKISERVKILENK